MSINFLLQCVRILHNGDFDDTEIRMIYDFLKNLDNSELISYFNTNSVLSYKNDLEFYIEVIDMLIKVLEEKEEYEKCIILRDKKEESVDIINIKSLKHEII